MKAGGIGPLVAGLALALSACGQPYAALTLPPGPVVPAEQAVAAFADICLDTAPDFDTAEARMARHGITVVYRTGTRYHPSGTLSAKAHELRRASGERFMRCSVVLEDPDTTRTRALLDVALLARDLPALEGPAEIQGITGWFAPASLDGMRVLFGYIDFNPGRPTSTVFVDIFEP